MSGGPQPTYPTTHKGHPIIVQERIYTLASWHRARSALIFHLPFLTPFYVSLLYSFKRENIPFLGVQKWVTNRDMSESTPPPHPSPFCPPLFSLLNNNSREKTIHPHTIIPRSWDSRNEWQIEIWVTNHFKILSAYYTWTLSWTTYYLTTQNNHVGEKNNSTFSIALDDPSSISTKRLCIFAHTIIHTFFLTLILCNGYVLLSNTITREKNLILIWLLINYLIKLTNCSCV